MRRILIGFALGLALVLCTTGAVVQSNTAHATRVRTRVTAHVQRVALVTTTQVHHRRKHHRKRHRHRVFQNVQWSSAVASWYDDTGETASGYHAYYGVANKYLAFGTRITFRYHGNEVTAVVDDRGPYVGDREYDLNQNIAQALGFDGVDTVAYYIH